MRRTEHPVQNLGRYRIGTEPPHIAAGRDDRVQRLALRRRERPPARVGGPLRRRAGIPDHRYRTLPPHRTTLRTSHAANGKDRPYIEAWARRNPAQAVSDSR
jgi:hypothetical protein